MIPQFLTRLIALITSCVRFNLFMNDVVYFCLITLKAMSTGMIQLFSVSTGCLNNLALCCMLNAWKKKKIPLFMGVLMQFLALRMLSSGCCDLYSCELLWMNDAILELGILCLLTIECKCSINSVIVLLWKFVCCRKWKVSWHNNFFFFFF